MQWNTDYKHTKHQKWWRTLLSVLTAVSWNTPPDRDCLHIPSEPELEPCWRKQKTGERSAGAGAGSGHLSPLVGRKAAAWCSCCRLDTGLVTTLPLWWPGVQCPGAAPRCWVQVRMYRVMVTFDPTHCVATPLDSESRQPRPSYERSFVPATTATAATDTGTRDSRGECRAVQCGEADY